MDTSSMIKNRGRHEMAYSKEVSRMTTLNADCSILKSRKDLCKEARRNSLAILSARNYHKIADKKCALNGARCGLMELERSGVVFYQLTQ